MEFVRAEQVDINKLITTHFDIFILAAGYEKRCTFLLENHTISADKKIAIAFKEKSNELQRKENNKFLNDNGFSFIEITGTETASLNTFLKDKVFTTEKRQLQILIDYSCMTKLWYSTIINYFIEEEDRFDSVQTFFSYTPAKFSLPKKVKLPRKAESIHVGTKKFDPSKPTALVIGLGYEKGRAEYLKKKVNPDLTCLMYADPAPDSQYVESVFKMNQDIMNDIDVRNLYNYPLDDLSEINMQLTNLCLDLRLRYNVILAPLGPKVHALSCVLLATRYPDIDVWRISNGSGEAAYDRIAGSDPLILEVGFANDDEV